VQRLGRRHEVRLVPGVGEKIVEEKNTVLIVDDMELGRQALEGLLLGQGYRLEFAPDGPEALRMAADVLPDLILLDVMMPQMDGFEVCRRIRVDSRLADVPVLLVTALDDRESRLHGIEAGADDFITKPFDRAELRARVRTITRLNRYRKLRVEHENLLQAHRELQATYDATIEGWVAALDLRDKETEGHSQRVTRMAVKVAAALGMEPRDIQEIRRGALLHDVGKLGVPDEILLKPGPLSEAEWTIMRRHPLNAYEWLSSIAYLRSALDIPYCHHEKWNGTGYPRGLRGEEIPLPARIFALVDVWDALRSDRPYRTGSPAGDVAEHIRNGAGTHFDPNLVNLFLEVALRKDGDE
jgi:putative two-component system response regulator